MRVLVIGGTRNVGHFLVKRLLHRGDHVTTLNRGLTPDRLPARVERLHADRTIPSQLRAALGTRSFDAVVDTTLYNGPEASVTIEHLRNRVGKYVFLSTGQVYLVRTGVARPFTEDDYGGPIMDVPPAGTSDYRNWLYGIEKREVENLLRDAFRATGFPFVSLRLPMINSERDHYNRIRGYLCRLRDGGPILVPAGKHLRLRHVYVWDVVESVCRAIDQATPGSAFNVGQDEALEIEEFLEQLAQFEGARLRVCRVSRTVLNETGFIPACSPFSDPWMSELDNTRSKNELGMVYTPVSEYLQAIVRYDKENPQEPPAGYGRRQEERSLASRLGVSV